MLIKKKVQDLKTGDKVDLEGDKYADPFNNNPYYASELAIVDSIEQETESNIIVYFEEATVSFPMNYELKVVKKINYNDLSDNEFDCILLEILQETKASELIRVPGIYEILREEFNNEILTRWENKQNEKGKIIKEKAIKIAMDWFDKFVKDKEPWKDQPASDIYTILYESINQKGED